MEGPPWFVSGEAVSAWTRPAGGVGLLPPPSPGVSCVGPWALVSATRAEESPAGPFLELAVAVPAHHGLHAGLTVVALIVDQREALVAARTRWGMPARVGRLHWGALGERHELWCDEVGVSVVGTSTGRPRPLATGSRILQRRADGLVVASRLHRAVRRRAAVTIRADDGPLAPLAGTWKGRHDAGLRLVTRRPRRPATVALTEPAPQTAPEPALSSLFPTPGSRAHSSAG